MNGDIERGRRFIGDQKFGLTGNRHRDHHALLLAAGHLMRVAVDLDRRLGNTHLGQKRNSAIPRRFARQALVLLEHFFNLVANAKHGIQRAHRLLKNHRDFASAQCTLLRV